jgi:Na+/melibiose symporter-like transporter
MNYPTTTAKYFRDLWMMFIAAVSSCLAAALLSYYLQPGAKQPSSDTHIFVYIGGGMGVAISLGALILWKQLTTSASHSVSFSEKLLGFKTAYLILLSMLEGASLMNFVFYFIEGLSANFFMAAAILLVLGSRFPSRSVIINMLRLSNQEQIYLHKEDHILS